MLRYLQVLKPRYLLGLCPRPQQSGVKRLEASAAAGVAEYLANRDIALAQEAERDAAAATARALQGGAQDENENDEDQSPAATIGRQGGDIGAAVSAPHSAGKITTSTQQTRDTTACIPAQDVLQQTPDNVTAAPTPGAYADATVAAGIQTSVTLVENVEDNTKRSPRSVDVVSPTSVVSPTPTVVQSDASRQLSARPDIMLSQAPTVYGTEEARKSKRSFWKQLERFCCGEFTYEFTY